MKIIFSRKGFDKSAGGVASPIFPDGGMRSLPIPAVWYDKHPPAPRYRVRYKDLRYAENDLGSVVEDLSFAPRKREPRIKASKLCHLGPDLIKSDLRRKRGWLPILGQTNTAPAHLLGHGVREGDLFLFFGWFRSVQKADGHFRFEPRGLDAHVVFGWLQIGEIWGAFHRDFIAKWARYHPDIREKYDRLYDLSGPTDVVFVAKRRLDIPNLGHDLPGGGVFEKYHPDLRLSSLKKGRSHWRVPGWMYPSFPQRMPLTHHEKEWRWMRAGDWALLQTVGRGQEFILDLDSPGYPKKYPIDDAYEWLRKLFRHA
jgi:hypothetical protein